MDDNPLPLDGLVNGRYRPVAVLGRGGMGCVYEAVDERLSRPVALKLVHTTDPTSSARLRAEATVLARLQHPNLVTVYDTGFHDGRPFVVTELVRGRTLRSRMDEGRVPSEELARIGSQVASALACAHDHGVVHRDVTPGNVLLTDGDGEARLIDFGISVSRDALALTATGLVIGTPAYLSPEQVEGRTASAAADVYSLGIVLIEALTGSRPFPGTPAESAGARLVADAPVPDGLPGGWGPLLAAMTAREPERRPGTSVVARRLATLAIPAAGPYAVPVRDPDRMQAAARPTGATALGATAGTARAGETTALEPVAPGTTASHDASPATTLIAPAAAGAAARGPEQATGARSSALRRRWPLAAAGLVLLAGLLVLAAFSHRSGDGPVPGVDPTSASSEPADQVSAVPTTLAPTPVTTPTSTTAPTTAPTTTSTAKGPGGQPGPTDGKGQTKGKGRTG